jgi:hypothetical protein
VVALARRVERWRRGDMDILVKGMVVVRGMVELKGGGRSFSKQLF